MVCRMALPLKQCCSARYGPTTTLQRINIEEVNLAVHSIRRCVCTQKEFINECIINITEIPAPPSCLASYNASPRQTSSITICLQCIDPCLIDEMSFPMSLHRHHSHILAHVNAVCGDMSVFTHDRLHTPPSPDQGCDI